MLTEVVLIVLCTVLSKTIKLVPLPGGLSSITCPLRRISDGNWLPSAMITAVSVRPLAARTSSGLTLPTEEASPYPAETSSQ